MKGNQDFSYINASGYMYMSSTRRISSAHFNEIPKYICWTYCYSTSLTVKQLDYELEIYFSINLLVIKTLSKSSS